MPRFLSLAPIVAALIISPAHAQDAGDVVVSDTGDTAWMLAASALVLLMTLPGLVLLYGGQGHAKNVLSMAMQIGAVTCIVSLLWIITGYTLAFGDVTGGWIGNGRAWMLIGLTNVCQLLAKTE